MIETICTQIISVYFYRKEEGVMRYGVAITIVQNGYVEVDANCEAEAKAKAKEAVSEERVLYFETEIKECKIDEIFLWK